MVELSIIIPAHNEERRIIDCLRKVSREFARGAEIIVAEDGSSDRTVELVESFRKENGSGKQHVRLLTSKKKLGKGGGLLRGIMAARGKNIVFMDADCSVLPSEIPNLLDALDDDDADVAIGSRTMPGARILVQPPISRRITGRAFTILVNLLFGLGSSDTQCGFKAMTRNAAERIMPGFVSRGFEADVEILARAKKNGLRVVEVPVNWSYKGDSKINVIRDSILMLVGVLRIWWALNE